MENQDARHKIMIGSDKRAPDDNGSQLSQHSEALERFHVLLDQSDEAILVVEVPSGKLVDVNDTACTWLASTRAMLEHKSVYDLEAMGTVWHEQLFDTPAKPGQHVTFTATFKRADYIMPVNVKAHWALFKQTMYVVVHARQTNDARAQYTPPPLRSASSDDNLLLHQLPYAIVLTDLSGTIQAWEGQAKQIFGYSSPEVIGQSLSILYRDDVQAMLLTRFLKKIAKTGHFFGEAPGVHKNGQPLLVEIMAQLIHQSEVTDPEIAQPMVSLFIRNITTYVEPEPKYEEALSDPEWRAQQLQTAAEVSHMASSILSLDDLLPRVVELIRSGFGFNYVGIFLVDDTFPPEETSATQWAVLQAGTGKAGQIMQEKGYKVVVGDDSMVGQCIATAQPQIILVPPDTDDDLPSSPTSLLPTIHSALALPLISRERVIGAMTIQSAEPAAFSRDDVIALQTMVDQLTTAIENARLFDQTLATLLEIRILYHASRVIGEATSIEEIIQGVTNISASLGFTACSLTLFTHLHEPSSLLRGDTYAAHLTEEGARILPVVRDFPVTTNARVRELLLQPEFTIVYNEGDAAYASSDEMVQNFRHYLGIQGGVIVGLSAQGHPLGLLAFSGTAPLPSFPLRYLHQIHTIGDRVAVAIANVHLVASLAEEKARLELLYSLSRVISESLDVHQVTQKALEEIQNAFNTTSGVVLVQAPPGNLLKLVAALGKDAEKIQAAFDSTEGTDIINRVAQEKLSILLPTTSDSRWRPLAGLGAWVQSTLTVPLISDDEFVGVLSLYSDQKGHFSQTQQQLAESAAATVAAAIINARLFSEAQRHAAEQSIVSRIVRALNTLNIEQAFPALGKGLKEITACESVSLAVLNTSGDQLTVTKIPPSPTIGVVNTALPVSEIIAWAHLKRGNPLLGSLETGNVPNVYTTLYMANARSYVSLPLLISGRIIGTLNLGSQQAFGFEEEQIKVLKQVADAVAIAVEKHRLFQAERDKRHEAETLREAALALSTPLEWDKVIDQVLQELQKTVPYDNASVQLLHDETLEVVGGRGLTNAFEKPGQIFPPHADIPHRKVVQTRQPYIVHNLPTAYGNLLPSTHMPTVFSWLGVPMLVGVRLLGIISLSKHEAHFYKPEHARLAEAFAAQAAVALENAQLFKAAQQRAFEQEILSQIVRTLNAMGAEAAFPVIVEEIQNLTQCDWINVVLVHQEKKNQSLLRQVYSASNDEDHFEPCWDDAALLQDVAEGKAKFFAPLDTAPDDTFNHSLHTVGFQARLSLPFTVGNRVLGIFNLAWRQLQLFQETQLPVLQQVANATAFAVENNRLFQAEQEQRMLAETLWETALFVNSVIELEPLLRLILDQLAHVITYESGTIQSLEGDAMRVIAVRNLPTELGRVYPLADYPYNQRLAQGEGPIMIRDIHKDNQGWQPSNGTQHVRSNLGVPLWVRDHVIGALTLDSSKPDGYTEADVQVAQAFAQQAAIAIENARLFEAEQEQRELAEALATAAATVSSTLDLDTVLDLILEQLSRVVKGDTFNIMLIQDGYARLVRWRGYEKLGLDDADVGGRNIPIEKYPNLIEMQLEGKSVIVSNTSIDTNWTHARLQEWRASYMAAPIIINEKVEGFLNVNGIQVGQFGPVELQWLEAFANHAAIAIHNARLFQQLQEYNLQLEQRVQQQTAQIQAHYTQLQTILNSTSDGIIVTNHKGEIIDTNPVVDTLLNRRLDAIETKQLRATVRDLALQAEARPERTLELSDIDLQLKVAPVASEREGTGAATVVAVHDISHLKSLDRMKSRFVSDVSHELRTPVTTITLLVSLLRRSPPNRWETYLEGLEQEAKRQSQLIEDILQVSRIDSGHIELKLKSIILKELVHKIISSHQVLAESHELALEHHIIDENLRVDVDRAQLTQVLNNLVENAIRYTPSGGKITITTGATHREGQNWANIKISDTGIGIPGHELEHIFERFYRGEEPRQRQISGSGLGLAIAKEILNLHGGRLTVESQVNKGSTFTVWLPLKNPYVK